MMPRNPEREPDAPAREADSTEERSHDAAGAGKGLPANDHCARRDLCARQEGEDPLKIRGTQIDQPCGDNFSHGRANASHMWHELLQALRGIDFSSVDVGVRIDRDLMDPVELAGIASTAAERAELLT